MVRVGATGGASKARMPEMNAQRLCRTQSQQSVHKEARTLCGARDYCLFARVVVMERVDAAIPPVVARIFSGDSTSPLTREASVIVLWRKWLYFKTMRMQGRLTLHVRRLVHISQVSSVFSEKSMLEQLH